MTTATTATTADKLTAATKQLDDARKQASLARRGVNIAKVGICAAVNILEREILAAAEADAAAVDAQAVFDAARAAKAARAARTAEPWTAAKQPPSFNRYCWRYYDKYGTWPVMPRRPHSER